MTNDNDESQSQSGRNWLTTLHEARTNCREKVADAMVTVPDPDQMLWPVVPRNRMKPPHKAAIEAHVAIIDYADQVAPYQDERGLDEELWEKSLYSIKSADESDLEISLENLDEWEFRFFTNTVEQKDELHGETEQIERYRVLLPVSSMRECYRQLNKITKELGFAADVDVAGLPKSGLNTPQPRS